MAYVDTECAVGTLKIAGAGRGGRGAGREWRSKLLLDLGKDKDSPFISVPLSSLLH